MDIYAYENAFATKLLFSLSQIGKFFLELDDVNWLAFVPVPLMNGKKILLSYFN